MVYRNNNINSENQEKKANLLPVYPFNVDVPCFPERKYLAGIYKFARISYVSLLISIILCIFIIISAFSSSIRPVFIKWNNIDNKFEYVKTNKASEKNKNFREISKSDYLTDYFLKVYLEKRFSISSNFSENYQNWCDCSNNNVTIPTTKMGVFNLKQECYLCKFSEQNVYKLFLDNEYSAYTQFAENGITRNIHIIKMQPIYKRKNNTELSFLELILQWFGVNNSKTAKTYKLYEVDFIIEEQKYDKLLSQDVLKAYIEVGSIDSMPEDKRILSASYMFNPNYDIVLNEYLKEQQEYKEEINGLTK